jgi:hypothetical protein
MLGYERRLGRLTWKFQLNVATYATSITSSSPATAPTPTPLAVSPRAYQFRTVSTTSIRARPRSRSACVSEHRTRRISRHAVSPRNGPPGTAGPTSIHVSCGSTDRGRAGRPRPAALPFASPDRFAKRRTTFPRQREASGSNHSVCRFALERPPFQMSYCGSA